MTSVSASRAAVASRIAVGTIGAYAFAASAAICLSFVLPGPRAESVLAGILVSFVLFLVVTLWAFADRSLARVWIGLTAATLFLGGVAYLIGPNGAP